MHANSKSFQNRIAKEIAKLIHIPLESRKYKHRPGAFGVVRIIFDIITEALKKNEEVNIPGLGVFTLWERPATRHSCIRNYLINEGAPPKPMVSDFPPKTYVHFKPDPSIIKALNADRLPRD